MEFFLSPWGHNFVPEVGDKMVKGCYSVMQADLQRLNAFRGILRMSRAEVHKLQGSILKRKDQGLGEMAGQNVWLPFLVLVLEWPESYT